MAKIEARSFRYQKRTREDVKERANAQGGGFDRFIKPQYKLYKVKDGKNIIRVLPPTWGNAKHYGFDIYVNYGIGVDDQSYLSLSRMKNLPDPLAEARRQAEREGNSELARQLNPNQRVLMWIIDRLDEDEGPVLWPAPFTVDKALANISFDEDTREVIYIDNENEGCDFRFYREGQGLKTKYDGSKMKLLKPGPLHEDPAVQQEWLDFVTANPLPECLQFYDYEHIAAVFEGKAAKPVRDEVPEEDTKPAKRRPAVVQDDEPEDHTTKKTKPVVQEVDDVEDDDEPELKKPSEATGSIRERLRRRRAVEADDDE